MERISTIQTIKKKILFMQADNVQVCFASLSGINCMVISELM